MKAVVFHGVGDIRLDSAIEAYKAFNQGAAEPIKVELKPASAAASA